MIEWAMIFALGVLVASLLWLGILPVLSRRALRLATARLAQRVPLSMAEITAERDQLRAVHAVAQRRLEQARDEAEGRVAAAMAENGRHLARIVALETQGAMLRTDKARLEAELTAANAALADAQGTAGTQAAMIEEALGLAERRGDQLNATEAMLAAEQALADERRATIAGLETRATGQDLRLRDTLAEVADLTQKLTATRSLASEYEAVRTDDLRRAVEREAVQASVESLTSDLVRLRGEQAEAQQAARQTDRRFQLQVETINGLADRVMARNAELAAMQKLLEEAQARRDAPGTVPFGPLAADEAGTGRQEPVERALRLRAAVAALGADLVALAEGEEPSPEAAGPS